MDASPPEQASTADLSPPMLRAELQMHAAEAEAALFGMPSVATGTAMRPPRSADLELGRFLLQRKLGEGGMGEVYQAYDAKLNRSVAIKLALVQTGSSAQGRESKRLMREAMALAQLNHPNVVHVYEVGTAAGQVFIVMELISGRDLRRWLADTPRRRTEVLEVFDQAAGGLAAAHAMGIVHRDFKLDNVVVGEDGRVRVVDFGLAVDDPNAKGSAESVASGRQASASISASGTLTTTVASRNLAGTPSYMAPEQHRGRAVDARSDQYSFCVALFEALYGARPFPGRELDALLSAKVEGKIQIPSDAPRVPVYLFRVLERGLSAEPEARFDSMEELRQALAHDPARRRRWTIGGAALMAGSLVLASVWHPDQPCTGAELLMEQVWNPERRDRLREVLLGDDRPDVEEVETGVRSRLDDYARTWTEGYVDACLAHDRGDHSDDLYDRRVACLERRRDALDQTVDVLALGGPKVLEHASQMTVDLPLIDTCADIEALTAEVAPPEDPADRERVAGLRRKLARVLALEQSERYRGGLELSEEVLGSARELGYAPVEAEALVMQGSLQRQLGAYEDAERLLSEGFFVALGSGHDEQAVNTARLLVFVLAEKFGRYQDAAQWGQLIEALLRRTDVPRRLRASVHVSMGALYTNTGDNGRALDEYHAALAIFEEIYSDDHPDIALTLDEIGGILQVRRDFDGARDFMERAKDIYERTRGTASLAVANEKLALAFLCVDAEDWDDARRWFFEARQGFIDGHGPDHPHLPYVDQGLGNLEMGQGNHEAAAEHYLDALEAARARFGDQHSLVFVLESTLADLDLERARYDDARSRLDGLLRRYGERDDPNDVYYPYTLLRRGRIDELRGDPDAAAETLRRAFEIAELADNPLPDMLAAIELAQARLARHGGDLERCAELVDRAAANIQRTEGGRRELMLPELRREQAALRLEQGEPARAREQLELLLTQESSDGAVEDVAEAEWVLARARAQTTGWDEEVDRLATRAQQRLRDAKLPQRADAIAQWRAEARR